MGGEDVTNARPRDLAPEEELQIREALRMPRGRYSSQRASHIAGVPERTIYHWAREKLVVPDFYTDHPKAWSYRDLVMLRLFVFFRARHKPVDEAAAQVRKVRRTLQKPDANLRTVRSTRYSLYLDDAVEDPPLTFPGSSPFRQRRLPFCNNAAPGPWLWIRLDRSLRACDLPGGRKLVTAVLCR